MGYGFYPHSQVIILKDCDKQSNCTEPKINYRKMILSAILGLGRVAEAAVRSECMWKEVRFLESALGLTPQHQCLQIVRGN